MFVIGDHTLPYKQLSSHESGVWGKTSWVKEMIKTLIVVLKREYYI